MQERIRHTPNVVYFETTPGQKDALRMAVLGHPQYGKDQETIVNTIIEEAKLQGNTITTIDFLALLLLFPNQVKKLH